MTKELETLLTELYVLLDDHVAPPRTGRGRRPLLSNAELLTLAVAQILLGFDCERRWIRHAHTNTALRAMFPYLPGQSGYHKRLEAARGLLANMIRVLAQLSPSWHDDLWITDATPVPCGMSRETVKRSDLAGQPATATSPPTPASSGGSSCTWCAPGTACRSCGRWRTRRSGNARLSRRCSRASTT